MLLSLRWIRLGEKEKCISSFGSGRSKYTRKSTQVVTKLRQTTCSNAVQKQLVNRMCSHYLFPAC